MLLRPQFSSSAVVAAEFHPERENYFCLAFADGTAAVYDANHFYESHGNGERRENPAMLGTGGEKAFIRGLHIRSTTRNTGTEGVTLDGYDLSTDSGGIGPKEPGISAVAFVPGRKATVVTVGTDGKCCVVDFTQPTKHKAVLLKSWHIRRPATSLSIICSTKKVIVGQFDGADDHEPEQRHDLPNESYYIAVGRSDGRVLLFDLDGKALGEQALDDKGARVIDVEWTQIGSGTVLPHQNLGSGIRRSPVVKRKRKSLGSSAFAETRPLQMELLAMSSHTAEHSEDPLFDFATPRKTLGAFHWEPPSNESTVAAMDPRDGVREGKAIVEANAPQNDSQQKPTHVTTKHSGASVPRKVVGNSSQTATEESSSFRSSTEDGSTPPIPPRPSPKPGGRLSMCRAQTSRQSDVQSTSYLNMMAKARKLSASNPRLSKAIAVANPPTKTKVLFGPRKPPSPTMNGSRDNIEASEVRFMSERPEDTWLDVPSETPRRGTSNQISPVSSATSSKSYKTAASHLYASDSPERSDDTVVDWSAGLPRQPVPTLQITHPSGERPSKAKSKRKSHVSLSVSSESAGTPMPTPSVSDAAASRSPAGSPPIILPSLPSTGSTENGFKQKAEPKQKAHVSLSVSSASNSDTITHMSSDSDGPIVQWPSLKKSPRIPELNKGLPDPKKYAPPPASSLKGSISESATDNILQEYTASPSPSPPKAANASWLVSTIYPEREAPSKSPPNVAPKPMLVSTVDLEREPHPRSCTCSLTVKSIIEASLATFRAEVTQHFEAQKTWFEELVRDEEEGRKLLAEENRWLRSELARTGIEKEEAKCRGGESGSSRA